MTRKYTRRVKSDDNGTVKAARTPRVKSTFSYKPADGLDLSGIPARVLAFRSARNLSQGDLATLCGVTRQTVVRWETVGPGRQNCLVTLALTCLSNRLVGPANEPPAPESTAAQIVSGAPVSVPDYDALDENDNE